MARFKATIQGNRGEVSRQGDHEITGHIRGCNIGVRVRGVKYGDKDVFKLYDTKGSNRPTSEMLIGEVRLDGDGMPIFNPSVYSKTIKALMACTDCIDDYITKNPKDLATQKLRNEIKIMIAEAVC